MPIHILNNSWKVKNLEEVNGGEKVTYKVVVKTGDRLGSSSEAKISLQIFGEKGKTKLIPLEKSSTHRIPFRKSNTDVFEIECYDLGTINAIQIGHNEQDIGIDLIISLIDCANKLLEISLLLI